MKKFRIQARTRGEALYVKNNPNGDPFKLKKKFKRNELILLGIGLGLWWGEGSKKHIGTIRLGNTDPCLITRFIEFLRNICGVEKRKFKFGLQIFNDVDPNEAKEYWKRTLDINDQQFLPKIVISAVRGAGTYRNKARNGVLTIYCSNVKLRKELDLLMKKYAYK
jgi:hypothetical protein